MGEHQGFRPSCLRVLSLRALMLEMASTHVSVSIHRGHDDDRHVHDHSSPLSQRCNPAITIQFQRIAHCSIQSSPHETHTNASSTLHHPHRCLLDFLLTVPSRVNSLSIPCPPPSPPPSPYPACSKADPRLMGAAAAGAAASGGLPMAIEMLTQAQFFAAIAKAGGGVLMFGPVGLISSTLTWTNFHAFWLQWDSRPVGECGGVTGTYMELAGTSITCISCLLTALILRWCDSLITKPHVSKRPQP